MELPYHGAALGSKLCIWLKRSSLNVRNVKFGSVFTWDQFSQNSLITCSLSFVHGGKHKLWPTSPERDDITRHDSPGPPCRGCTQVRHDDVM